MNVQKTALLTDGNLAVLSGKGSFLFYDFLFMAACIYRMRLAVT